ncbi:MAG: flagellar biosynthetic protein FliO [Candidatus Puniceispirillum sp.]|jgi:flagellar biogenesis protein FliO|uniref:flagellar biosynthetic protein FliO n=1 Tax=Candidatus Puniceispirillum sp. TaxID=2026719 RepID=UPI001EBF9228|nr:flagellar biosynthetic protein FliO [Candidatus Puniceispirillum sp.]MBT6414765.1 flagellar biosynthetic protein FliO [Candidatus Puniceispirillum sp.]MBT6566458.1 flagellar biosynthetic protein FliO [Candidatus Puniceispirillum sp.]
MTLTTITTEQGLITLAFLTLMLLLLIIVRKFRGGIKKRFQQEKRIHLIEEMSMSPHERLRLVDVAGTTFLIFTAKGQPGTIVQLDKNVVTSKPVVQKPAPPPTQPPKSTPSIPTAKPASQTIKAETLDAEENPISAAIKQARLRNPKLGLEE